MSTSKQRAFVEVVLPVPLRKRFTYAVPDELQPLKPGARVAVVFNRRKLPAFVVSQRESAPEGVKRILSVSALLENEPVFPEELLRFLEQAAAYYMHPIGEVFRAAAPALPKGALRQLRDQGFLESEERLPGRSVARRKEWWATRTALNAQGVRLGVKQRAVLERLESQGPQSSAALRDLVAAPLSVLRALRDKGLVALQEREVATDPFFRGSVAPDVPPPLNAEQQHAVEAVTASFGEGGAFLLHGVTGSGKTEVYLRLVAETLRAGKGALILVPEIALTPQLVSRFRARFGDDLAVLHSALTDKERDQAWRALRAGEVQVAIGARSALFAPVRRLGLLVVDEEHDPSFKQEEGFRYHARDMALLRAHRADAVCVLGSATPSVETFQRALDKKLRLLTLPQRATGQGMPTVEIIDMRRHRDHQVLSAPLHHALQACLQAKTQAILFLNRRGFAPSLRCVACGELVTCPACSVSLTEHRYDGLLRCHYCDFAKPPGENCDHCGQAALKRMGLGTEQLEAALKEMLPSARIARLDRDTASGRGVEAILDRLKRHEIDILVGTQMVTKGHDIAGVTLVGVVAADQSLGFPDFRASERTFQLLAQVAGRAGRADKPGRVIFQSYKPEHPAVRFAAQHDYEGFFAAEISDRRELGYPPFGRMLALRVHAGDEQVAWRTSEDLKKAAALHPSVAEGQVRILGPAPAPLARLRGRFRFQMLLCSPEVGELRKVGAWLAQKIDEGVAPARATLDVDPVAML